MNSTQPRRIVVAITGASGAIYGVRILEALREIDGCESHLVLSAAGGLTASQELDLARADLERLADVVHSARDIGATVASGSFATLGMVVAPCSMKTLASIAHGLSDNLVARAADVVLKERRRLVLLTRETPLNLAHLRNMVAVTEMGAIVCPPVPAFYNRPESIAELVDHTVARVLDLFDLDHRVRVRRWPGLKGHASESPVDSATESTTASLSDPIPDSTPD